MCVNARRVAKLTLYVSDLQKKKLEDYMSDVRIEDDYICGDWIDKELSLDKLEIVLDASVVSMDVSELDVYYNIMFKVVNKHDNDEYLNESQLERLKDTLAQIESMRFRYQIKMYQSVYYELG